MSMANRNDPDVRQHETLPGLSPAKSQSLSLPGGARPVEQMMDAAIERIAFERDAFERDGIERGSFERNSFERNSFEPDSFERGAHEQHLSRLHDFDHDSRDGGPTRLRWKGLDVSEEFRDYAERVARGEDLPPFEGRVLAEPNAAFPWGSLARSEPSTAPLGRPGRGGQAALWASAAVVMALLAGSVALKLEAIEPSSASVDVAALTAVTPPAPESPAAPEQIAPPQEALQQLSAPAALPPGTLEAAAPIQELAAVATPAVAADPNTPALPAAAPAAALAVSVAPAPPEQPLATGLAPIPALPPLPQAAAVPAPPAPKPAPVARAANPDVSGGIDFGIDELPLSSGSGAKSSLNEPGNIGDLARVGQPASAAARKEPGSASSAKGSLLVENPSF